MFWKVELQKLSAISETTFATDVFNVFGADLEKNNRKSQILRFCAASPTPSPGASPKSVISKRRAGGPGRGAAAAAQRAGRGGRASGAKPGNLGFSDYFFPNLLQKH